MKFSDYDAPKKENERPDTDARKLFGEFLKGYEGKSEDELIASIMKTAKQKRADGTLTDEELQRFYSMIVPLIPRSKKDKLDEVYELIKKS